VDSIGSDWEQAYFHWFEQVQAWNTDSSKQHKKLFFLSAIRSSLFAAT
jgi:hypothetical protein